jgi:hypothetical protein
MLLLSFFLKLSSLLLLELTSSSSPPLPLLPIIALSILLPLELSLNPTFSALSLVSPE